ncbi:MAG: ATP-binding protein [Acetobacteraceae bacterium]
MIRLWPRSLAARTAVVLLAALIAVQVAGLSIDAMERRDLRRLGAIRDISIRLATLYRRVSEVPSAARAAEVAAMPLSPGTHAEIAPHAAPAGGSRLAPAPEPLERAIRVAMHLVPMPPWQRPPQMIILGGFEAGRVLVGMRLSGPTEWLLVSMRLPPPQPWHSPTFLAAFALMTVVAAGFTIWAVRRLTKPLRTFTAAAERLGRDVHAPPLSEEGPSEIATAAAAFNTMAARIRRFVEDRTFLLTAMGHDLRTPITRLRLRAEFIEDDEQRQKLMKDLDEIEAMVAATLDFGRNATASEPAAPIDLALLCQTVLDEAADVRPEAVDSLAYSGPAHCTARARTGALKRALGNLVNNAISYGGGARLTLLPPEAGAKARTARIEIEDDGPGIPPADLERVFQPFQRLESSRNRETGGIGLGLSIARDILRAHGGDVTLANRPSGGAKAVVTLPV